MNTQRYRTEFKNLLERTSLPEGISIEERNERLLPLSMHLVKYVPPKLFRYTDFHQISNSTLTQLGIHLSPLYMFIIYPNWA